MRLCYLAARFLSTAEFYELPATKAALRLSSVTRLLITWHNIRESVCQLVLESIFY
jgi:hypothetical protein